MRLDRMGGSRSRRLLMVAVFEVFCLLTLSAQSNVGEPTGLKSEGMANWNDGRFYVTLKCNLPVGDEAVAPKRRYRAELFLQQHLKEEFVTQVSKLQAESTGTLGELAKKEPALLGSLSDLSDKLRFHSSRVDENFTQLEMRYSIGLFDDLAPLLAEGGTPNPLPELVRWVPTRAFSGLVIFAMGPLPWKGTGRYSDWTPALAFKLLNQEGEVIFDRSMVSLESMTKWGMAALNEKKFNEEKVRDRIGFDPMRIVARGVWGSSPTDLVLADEDWDRILAQPENRVLLAEGRILILWGSFPSFETPPNPDSVVDETQPAIQVIPQAPPPGAAAGPKKKE